ncbi:MAG: hypothetical protein IKV46_00335 [Bacteroidales bacterium]|nr:hypothetical protein [Bacteroidales bacterium]
MPITNNNEEQGLQQEQLDVVQEIDRQDNYEPIPEINQVDITAPAPAGGIVNVNVKDKKSPIIFLFGPPAAGKTMTLVRLYRYLNSINTNIKPNKDFVSNDGGEYVSRCDNFHNDAVSNLAAEATKGVNFMLLDIWDNGAKKCQILESPGERLFEPDHNKEVPFPVQYVSSIIDSDNRKVYIFILEPNYKDDATRVRYKDRIAEVKQMMDKKDKVIFLYNKIDCSPSLDDNGNVNIKSLREEINDDYPGLLDLFKVKGPRAIIREYDCYLIPFQTGTYSEEFNTVLNKKVKIFTAGKNKYPQELWNAIKKCL